MLIVLCGLALIIMGITMLFNPQLYYELTESWKHDGGGGPSDLFMVSIRFGGVMCTLAGITGLAVLFIW